MSTIRNILDFSSTVSENDMNLSERGRLSEIYIPSLLRRLILSQPDRYCDHSEQNMGSYSGDLCALWRNQNDGSPSQVFSYNTTSCFTQPIAPSRSWIELITGISGQQVPVHIEEKSSNCGNHDDSPSHRSRMGKSISKYIRRQGFQIHISGTSSSGVKKHSLSHSEIFVSISLRSMAFLQREQYSSMLESRVSTLPRSMRRSLIHIILVLLSWIAGSLTPTRNE